MKRLGLAALLSLFILSLTVVSGACQEVTVGVSVGDHFMYEYNITIDGDISILGPLNEHNSKIYSFFETWNTTDWERREVIAVSGTVITFNVTTRYINGTVANKTVDFNLTSSHDLWVIGAEMEAGEQAGVLANQKQVYINETMQWTYENETRDTNTASWDEDWAFIDRSMWWDKQTGVLVKEWAKWHIEAIGYPEDFVTIHAWHTLTDTNRWDVPEFPSGTAMVLVFVAVTVCVDIYRRKKLKKF